MIESARALRGGLLFVVLFLSILGAPIPGQAAAYSDAVAAKDQSHASAHLRHGPRPKASKLSEEPGLVQGYVKRGMEWVIGYATPAITKYVTKKKNEFLASIKAYSFLGLIGLFILLVVSAFIGTSLANGSFVRKLYKIVERLNPTNKPVILVLDENQMKVINPLPTQPVLESPSDKIGQLAKKEPVVIDIKPRAKRRASLTPKLRKIRRKSRTEKEAA